MIEFDSTAYATTSVVSNPSWNHTCSGRNRILLVGIIGGFGPADNVTSVTYGSEPMTLIRKDPVTHHLKRYLYLYYKIAPKTGTNQVQVLMSALDGKAYSISYKGVKQKDQPDAHNLNVNSSSSSITGGVTTTVKNAMVVGLGFCFGKKVSAGSNTTQRLFVNTDNNPGWFDSGTPVATPSARNLAVSATGSDTMFLYSVGLRPALKASSQILTQI